MKLELWYPVKPSVVTQIFGVNGQWYQSQGINIIGHNGIDYFAPHGTAIRAALAGTVVYVGTDANEGVGVVVRTDEPLDYEISCAFFKTIYWHLCRNDCHNGDHAIPVSVGDRVVPGTIIGYADNTGLSTGDHLHFGLKPQALGENEWTWINTEQDNGYFGAINPFLYFSGYCAEDYGEVMANLNTQISVLRKVVELFKKILGL